MITADQLKDVMDRADALHHYLNIDQKKVEFEPQCNLSQGRPGICRPCQRQIYQQPLSARQGHRPDG